jgi:hypothetical protein
MFVVRFLGRQTARTKWLALLVPVVALGLLAGVFAKASSASADPAGLPPGLQPTQVNVSNDAGHRYGEPVVMANPKNPNNLVYFVLGPDLNTTCEANGDPTCAVGPYGFPNGLLTTNGWQHDHVFTSFDRGRTWAAASFPNGYTFPCCVGPGGSLEGSSDPNITATKDGTFYIAFDVQSSIANGISQYAAGVAAAKSTDGGRTWSKPVIVGTPIDRPWMVSDESTGRVYVESGSPPTNGYLGPYSTGDPTSARSSVTDRWVVSTMDGVHWTTPQRLGGGGTPGYSITGSSKMSAAHGVLATTFAESSNAACEYFVGAAAPCAVFQTSTDSGVTWTRHVLPVPSDAFGTLWVAADPTRAGHFTVAVMNSTSSELLVYQTFDMGATWQGPTAVTEDTSAVHYKPWISYSSEGVLGVMWRSTVPATTAATTASAIRTMALITRADDPSSDPTDCNIPPGVSEDCNDGDPPTGAYTIWAAISYNGGASFSNPLEISTAPSPVPPATASQSFDDDSYISLNKDDVYVAWADWRTGERQAYFSDAKLQAFTFPGHN